jgi:hypothetical protein
MLPVVVVGTAALANIRIAQVRSCRRAIKCAEIAKA